MEVWTLFYQDIQWKVVTILFTVVEFLRNEGSFTTFLNSSCPVESVANCVQFGSNADKISESSP